MDHRRIENFYIVVAPGLEEICAAELQSLQISPQERTPGGVSFSGKLRDLYTANLWLRTASRIVVRFAELQSRDFPGLYRKACRLPWGRFVKPEASIEFRVTCHNSRLNHTARIAETLESAINQSLGRSSNPASSQRQLVLARLVNDQLTLSIDSSGDLLHRRGYRQAVTAAPLRETLAAGVLMLLGWDGREALSDPMCGSGSLPIEGAMLASRRAPGIDRSHAFMVWPGYREGLWKLLCEDARRAEVAIDIQITGADKSPDAIAAAEENAMRSGINGVDFRTISLDQQVPQDDHGLIVCNPPYGKRLSPGQDVARFYKELGQDFKRIYRGWRTAIICPDQNLVKATGLPFKKVAELDNGGLRVGVFLTERLR